MSVQAYLVEKFLERRSTALVLDVRSPGEYAQGHIPGALSFPLFTDEERAKVGTCYKQQGPELALEMGLRFVGPKMAGFVRDARRMADGRPVLVHCWRGGKRSGSMAWLLRQAGMEVATLTGGYKQYRQWVLQSLSESPLQLFVVGGKTGIGKTRILHALRDLDEQVLDLEAMAHHKGSSFGSIGEAPQPSVEQFENNLAEAVMQLDPARRVWVENESRSIGRVFIPEGFWKIMKNAPLYNVSVPESARLENLLADYTACDKDELIGAFRRIEKKLGGQHLKAALEALETDDFATAATIALRYYDKTYQHCLDQNVAPEIRQFDFETGDAGEIAAALLAAARGL